MITTDRLEIIPLSHSQLVAYTSPDQLEKLLGLTENGRTVSERITAKIISEILPKIVTEKQSNLFDTFWIIVLKPINTITAEFCFKGEPNDDGVVTIGYATGKEFQNAGIMTEAIQAIISWVFKHTTTRIITATTDPTNYSSHRVLEKNRFVVKQENPDNWIWELEKCN